MTPEARPANDGSSVPGAEPKETVGTPGKAPAAKALSPAVLAAAKRIGRRPLWARPYASGRTRARWLQTFLAITALAGLGLIGSDLLAVGLARDIASGAQITRERVDLALAVWWLTTILATVALLASFVLLLVWVHRAYRNLHALGARYLGDSPGWAAGSFLIPAVNLVMPVLIVGSIWRGSEPEQDSGPGGGAGRRPSVPLLVLVWWVLWVLSAMARAAANFAEKRAESNEELLRTIHYAMAVHGLTVVAFILTLVVVRIIQNMQDRKWAKLSAAGPAGAPATEPGA
jgi:hypothetical protein